MESLHSFSLHSAVYGEESTFEYPHPDPELNRPVTEETSLNGDSSLVSEGFEVRVCERNNQCTGLHGTL